MANFGAGGGSFGGSSAGSAYLRMTLDTGSYQAKLNSARSATVKSTSSMGKEFQKLGTLAKQALGALGAVQVLRASIAAYDAQTKAVARLNNTLQGIPELAGATADAFLEQATALSRLTGMGDEAIIDAQALLGTFHLTEEQLLRVTPLVADLAAKFGIDLKSASLQVGKALAGQIGALKRSGITIDETAYAADRFGTVLAALEEQAGGAAAALATPMDKMRVAVDEAFEAIGGALAPALTEISGILRAVPAPVLAAATAFGVLALAINAVPALVITAGVGLGALINKVNPLTNQLEEAGAALNDLFHMALGEGQNVEIIRQVEIDRLTDMARRVAEGSLSVKEFHATVDEFNQQYGGDLQAATLIKWALHGVGGAADDAGNKLQNFMAMTEEELASWQESAAGSLNFVEAALGRVAGRADSTAAGLLKAVRIAMEAQNNYAANANTAFSAVREEFGNAGDAFINYVAGLGQGGARLVGILAKMAGNNRAKFNSIVGDFITAGGAADATASRIAGIGDAVRVLPNGKVIKITTTGVEAALANLYAVKSAAASQTMYIGVQVASPYGDQAAQGGIVKGAAGFITRGPMMLRPNVMVGEGRTPTPYGTGAEAVIPLNSQGKAVLREVFSEVMGSSATVNVNGYAGDPERLADYIVRRMARSA